MKNFSFKNLALVILAVVVGIVIANLPVPEGLEKIALTYLGIFIGMLVLLVTNPIPTWASCLGALSLMVVFKVGTIPEVFSAFSGSIVWLMIAVFAFSAAVINSGLMTRLALKLLTIFPKNYFGQVLSLMTIGTVMSPMIPSSNAKVNLLIPMATEMTKEVGYEKRSKPALGLFSATFMPPYIGSHAFLTGNANVPFMIGIMGLTFSWTGWFEMTWVWLILILLGTFVFCMTYCKPKEKLDLPPTYFADKLKTLGKMSSEEKITTLVIILCLIGWITQPMHGVDAGIVCMLGVIVLTFFKILTTQAFKTQVPWDLIIFIGSVIGSAGFLTTLGVSTWLSTLLSPVLSPLVSSVWILVPAVCVITWIMRAVIPSFGVVLIILYSIFSPLLVTAGISPFILCFPVYTAANIWFNSFQNPFVIGTLGIAGNEYVTIKEFKKTAYAYMIMTLIATFASIPLWSMLGLC